MSEAVKLVSEYLMDISEMFAGSFESKNPYAIKAKKSFLEETNDSYRNDCLELKNDMIAVGEDFHKGFNEYQRVNKNG